MGTATGLAMSPARLSKTNAATCCWIGFAIDWLDMTSRPPYRRRAEVRKTRADMLILTGAGKNLPVEAKRHFHAHIWTAASTQLQDYTNDGGAEGFGVTCFGLATTKLLFPLGRTALQDRRRPKPWKACSLRTSPLRCGSGPRSLSSTSRDRV